jgi:hypothetical protein
MWSDYVTKKCRQCGEVMAHLGTALTCRACQLGACDDKDCRKHDKAGRK